MWRSPTVLVSIGAVVVALAAIVALNLSHGGGTGNLPSPTSTGNLPAINQPAVPIPASIPRDGRTLGAASAPAALDVWADFQCPGCGGFSRDVEPVLIQRYVAPGKLRLTFHDYAFLGQESIDAASAARCAGEQGKFWEYQALVYANQHGENQGWFSRSRLEAFAVAAGLDQAAWVACYDGGTQRQAVADETAAGQAAGVLSTPSLFLNGKSVDMTALRSWDDLNTLIDQAIGAAGSPAAPASPASPTASTP